MSTKRTPKPRPPLVHVEETQWQRAREYGECTAALIANPEAAGAEALFNQALSNGLAAIVSHHWPGEDRRGNGRVKSAADLLSLINRKVRRRGNMRVLEGRLRGYRWRTAIATNVLAEGVRQTDPVRHGSNEGSRLEKRHIDELVKLDSHPSLQSLTNEVHDEHWRQEVSADRDARWRALVYIRRLSPEEWARRQEPAFVEQHLPFDPKERYSSFGADLCPVCGLETLIVQEIDPFGVGVGAGTCVACGYTRTAFMAEDEAMYEKIQWELGKGD
jgi:hypothetical protein